MDFQHTPVLDIEAELGRRIEAARLAANITQAELAAAAGIARRTVSRIEAGTGSSLETLIRVLRALGLADRLDALLPHPEVRPIERIRLQGRQRQRARPTARDAASEWTWADDDESDTS